MKECKYCKRPLTDADIKWVDGGMCHNCQNKRKLVRKLIETCDEFKKIINYDEILKRREKEGSENVDKEILYSRGAGEN